MMQPYSELANWDGSLSAPDSRSPSEPLSSSVSHSVNIFRDDVPEMLDPLQTDPNPLPLSLHDPSIYNLYHKHPQTSDHHHQVLISLICYAALSTPADSNTRHFQASHTVAHPRPPSPHAPSASFDLPSSDTPFLSNVQDADVLSPQEREIMADITLDPDDPAAWVTAEKGKDASGPFHNLHGEVRANILQVCLYLHQSATSDSLLIFFYYYFFTFFQHFPALPRRYSVAFFLFFFSLLHTAHALKSQDRRRSRLHHSGTRQKFPPHQHNHHRHGYYRSSHLRPSRQLRRPSLLRRLPHGHRPRNHPHHRRLILPPMRRQTWTPCILILWQYPVA